MLFERFEESGLSQYSYAVGCPGAGRVAIVDPRRDIDLYLEFAGRQQLQISHVLETHIHADFASGARELAHVTGAEQWVSGYDKGELYEVAFPHRDVFDGDELELGSVRIKALHTPGHTPEHLSFLVFDGARSRDVPQLLLSGDFLFVGSLGRPDLLGEEEKEQLARKLYESVRLKIAELPDGLEVHPGHGAGTMCGAGMSARPMSTLGFERIANPYLNPKLARAGFVQKILAKVPPFPDYYRRMKELNSRGPEILKGLPGNEAIGVDSFRKRIQEGATVIDLRDQLAFGGGHIPNSYGIGFASGLSTWASWVVPYEKPILLVSQAPTPVEGAIRALIRVGLDGIQGHLAGGISSWRDAGLDMEETPQLSARQLKELLERGSNLTVIDVRSDGEWAEGHIAGSCHHMAGFLPQQLDQLPAGPLAILCGSGYRSTVVAGVLEQNGFEDVSNVTGGITAWQRAGFPVVTD